MDWPEIKRRLTKEGTSVQILADLAGVPYKTMYNRIMQHQKKDGVQYLTPENVKKGAKLPEEAESEYNRKLKKAAAEVYTADIRDTLPEDVPKLPEDITAAMVNEVLQDAKKAHAAAVEILHEKEEQLEREKKQEIHLRTVLLALERL